MRRFNKFSETDAPVLEITAAVDRLYYDEYEFDEDTDVVSGTANIHITFGDCYGDTDFRSTDVAFKVDVDVYEDESWSWDGYDPRRGSIFYIVKDKLYPNEFTDILRLAGCDEETFNEALEAVTEYLMQDGSAETIYIKAGKIYTDRP